jgi:hypothetical protein
MDYYVFLYFIFGCLIKLYDDIFDNNEFGNYFSELSIEIIKNFIICIYSIISIHNTNIPFITLISHIALYLIDNESLNNSLFISGMLITLFLCIFIFNATTFNLSASILTIIGTTIGLVADHLLFPEESSIKKIIGRISFIFILFILHYHLKDYMIDIVGISYGYYLTSIIIMMFTEYTSSNIKYQYILESIKRKYKNSTNTTDSANIENTLPNRK